MKLAKLYALVSNEVRWILQLLMITALLAGSLYIAVGSWSGIKFYENADAFQASLSPKGPDPTKEPGRPSDPSKPNANLSGSASTWTEAAIEDKRRAIFMEWESIETSFAFVEKVPKSALPLLAALVFGMIGGVTFLLKAMAVDEAQFEMSFILVRPLFGAAMGGLIYFLTIATPAIFTATSGPLRIETLSAFAVFGGAFASPIYRSIESNVVKLIQTPKAQEVQKRASTTEVKVNP